MQWFQLSLFQEVLSAFLFGSQLHFSSLEQVMKKLGVYHLVVFSGAHVIAWRLLLRKWMLIAINCRRIILIEVSIFSVFVLMHVLFTQGWAARRSITLYAVMTLISLIFGSYGRSLSHQVAIHLLAVAITLIPDLSALKSMGVWMSITGSLMLVFLLRKKDSTDDFPALGVHVSVSLAVGILQWQIAQLFGFYYYLESGLILTFIYGIALDRFFGFILFTFVLSFVFPPLNRYGIDAVHHMIKWHEGMLEHLYRWHFT